MICSQNPIFPTGVQHLVECLKLHVPPPAIANNSSIAAVAHPTTSLPNKQPHHKQY